MRIRHYWDLLKDMFRYLKALGKKYKEAKFHPVFLGNCNYALEELINPYNVKIHQFGDLNYGKTVAVIQFPALWIKTAGFFALFNRTLCALSFCDRLGLIPTIENWNACAYEEKGRVNGSENVFEYYFQPLSAISIDEAYKSFSVIIPSNPNMDLVLNQYNVEKWYAPSEEYVLHMGNVWRKYIHLKENLKTQVFNEMREILLSKKTLGVHFRGTDFKLNVNNHPKSISEDDYFFYIDEALASNKYEQIYLATDDLEAIECFSKRYKNIVYYKDVFRAKGNVSVAYSNDERENHHYRLGYEVIRDVYTLGNCQGLIVGASQVNIAARIYKSSIGETYEYFKLIDKGINENNIEWIDYYKKNIDKGE